MHCSTQWYKSTQELKQLCSSYKHVHLFLGNGPRLQYEDVEEVWRSLAPVLDELDVAAGGADCWLAVFGGDSDLGYGHPPGYDLGRVRKRIGPAQPLTCRAVGDGDGAEEEGDQTVGRGGLGRGRCARRLRVQVRVEL
eukprot:661761-Hanusia_phi.AAC.2